MHICIFIGMYVYVNISMFVHECDSIFNLFIDRTKIELLPWLLEVIDDSVNQCKVFDFKIAVR